MKYLAWIISIGLIAAVAAVSSGCGGSDDRIGGAAASSTVTAEPAEPQTPQVASNGGGTPAGGGTTPGGTTDGGSEGTGGPGTFAGRITVTGGLPQLPPIINPGDIKPADAAVCKAPSIRNESLLVQDGGLANVFIYLDKAPRGADIPEPEEQQVIFDQKDCVFVPHALSVQIGQTVQVLNDDAVAHNTHTFPLRNKPFNSVVKVNDRVGVPLIYDKSEKLPLEVKCDFHPWMRAYHLPLEHPFVAVTDANGEFRIENLPAGSYKFIIWHERKGYLDRGYRVTIKGGDEVNEEISYGAEEFASFDGPRPRTVTIAGLK